jgi:hypothetical protein
MNQHVPSTTPSITENLTKTPPPNQPSMNGLLMISLIAIPTILDPNPSLRTNSNFVRQTFVNTTRSTIIHLGFILKPCKLFRHGNKIQDVARIKSLFEVEIKNGSWSFFHIPYFHQDPLINFTSFKLYRHIKRKSKKELSQCSRINYNYTSTPRKVIIQVPKHRPTSADNRLI